MAKAKAAATNGKSSTNGQAAHGEAPGRLQTRRVSLDDLHIDPANARSHPETNMQAIRASLATFGQVEPLVVHKGTNKVIGGNGRLAAMREMGLAACDVVEFDGSPTQAAALGIALNRTSELATWDDTALAETLRALQSEDFDLAAVGYQAGEVDALIEGLARTSPAPLAFTADDDAPADDRDEAGFGDADGDDDADVSPPESHVRMVQLFLTVETFPEFQKIVTGLASTYQTANTTDTVLEALRRAHYG